MNRVGESVASFITIKSQDNAYFKYIMHCVIVSGLKAMEKSGLSQFEFNHCFDSQKRIILTSEIIGAETPETADLAAVLDIIHNTHYRNHLMPFFENKNHFGGAQSFTIYDRTLLKDPELFTRNGELGNCIWSFFLPRNKFDYLMGFKDTL